MDPAGAAFNDGPGVNDRGQVQPYDAGNAGLPILIICLGGR